MHFVVWQKLTQHCTLSSNFFENHFNISFLIAFEVFKWLSCLSSLRHHWWKRDYMFLSNTWVWHCSLHVLKKKKKKSQGNLVFGETRSYTHQQRFPYRPTCGEGFVYLLKSMKRFHTDHLFFPWHWGDDAQEGCRLVAHWLGSLARGRRRKHSGKIRDLPAAFHQAVWWQDSLFSQSSPVQSESLNVGVRESIPR